MQKTAQVGRATFYRLFDNTADVLAFLCDDVFEQVSRDYVGLKPLKPKEMTLGFIQKWMDNKTLLKAIVDCNRIDFLYNSHAKYLGADVGVFFPNENMNKERMTYLMTTMTACTAAFLVSWLKNGSRESAEELKNRLKDCFSVLCKIYN